MAVGALIGVWFESSKDKHAKCYNSQILELMFYEFVVGHNVAEWTKNNCYTKSEGSWSQNTN